MEIVTPVDFGDAPEAGGYNYPTTLANNGASHLLGSDVYLGTCVDAEPDGQPSADAYGDDGAAGSYFGTCVNDDDEDGVTFLNPIIAGRVVTVRVTAHAPCSLTAWIDFNQQNGWADADEEIFTGESLSTGDNILTFTAPSGLLAGSSYARFRCTTSGVVSYTGQAPDGEVEDYQVALGLAFDFGDAPARYPTLLADNGAAHVLGSGICLGSCVDAETNGQPTPGADGDDTTSGGTVWGTCVGGDDEDGVAFVTPLIGGQTANIVVTTSASCKLSAWIDFDQDGDWGDTDDQIFADRGIVAGANDLSFPVPPGAKSGYTYARFRCTTDSMMGYEGQASDGEVEDYRVEVLLNLGDYVWDDTDRDGIQDAGEEGVPDIDVALYDNGDCTGNIIQTDTTDTDGFYLFTDLVSGTYCIQFSNIPAGWSITLQDQGMDDAVDSDADQTTAQIQNIVLTASDLTRDMGLQRPTPIGGITRPDDPLRLLTPWVGLAVLASLIMTGIAVVVRRRRSA